MNATHDGTRPLLAAVLLAIPLAFLALACFLSEVLHQSRLLDSLGDNHPLRGLFVLGLLTAIGSITDSMFDLGEGRHALWLGLNWSILAFIVVSVIWEVFGFHHLGDVPDSPLIVVIALSLVSLFPLWLLRENKIRDDAAKVPGDVSLEVKQ